MDFEQIVSSLYEGLYRFAYSLAGNPDDAFELTQDTFARLLTKHMQIREHSKVKAWLSTTLYRTYLGWKRREVRYPHVELASATDELPLVTPAMLDSLENESLSRALLQIEERYRMPLALFYFEQHSYTEISEMLDIPVGTVMSRLARGKELLRKSLAIKCINEGDNCGPFSARPMRN